MRLVFLLILFLSIPAAQAQVLLEQEHWPNGTLRYMKFVQGNRLYMISYHENGSMKEQSSFRNGRQDGEWKQFTDNGTMLAHVYFNNGEPSGEWRFRTSENEPLGLLQFRNGALRSGARFENGEVIARKDYP